MKIWILIGVLNGMFYLLGVHLGECRMLEDVKACIEAAEDWDGFLEYFSDIWRKKIG